MRIRPRALVDALLAYPRYLGAIKPGLLGSSEAEFRARLKTLDRAWWPKALDVPCGRRILAIAPHPDDESIGAGGFLLRHRGLADVHVLNVFDGAGGGRLAAGPWQDTPAYRSELVAARQAELAEAARRAGVAGVRHLGFPDGGVEPDLAAAGRLREAIGEVDPDVILLPWFLDRQHDHRVVNVLFGWACADLRAMVLGYEIWEMLTPNALLDIEGVLDEKLELIRTYRTQLATVDYVNMSQGLARTRAFYNPLRPDRSGAVEAFLALPAPEYAELVQALYGPPGRLSQDGARLLS